MVKKLDYLRERLHKHISIFLEKRTEHYEISFQQLFGSPIVFSSLIYVVNQTYACTFRKAYQTLSEIMRIFMGVRNPFIMIQ